MHYCVFGVITPVVVSRVPSSPFGSLKPLWPVSLVKLVKLVKCYLFDEADEAAAESPGLVAVTLQGADGHLLRLLHCHGNHVHRVIHQSSIRLQGIERERERERENGWRGE